VPEALYRLYYARHAMRRRLRFSLIYQALVLVLV
jgi:hypothetical protein